MFDQFYGDNKLRVMYGVVITFTEGLTKEQVEEIVREIGESANIDNITPVAAYNPDHGDPVWYVP